MKGFINFIREQGVMGLAIGFLLGGAVSKTVASLVENIINPLVGLLLGRVNLNDKMITIGDTAIKYGAFISTVVDFIIVAAVIYFGFKMLGIEKIKK